VHAFPLTPPPPAAVINGDDGSITLVSVNFAGNTGGSEADLVVDGTASFVSATCGAGSDGTTSGALSGNYKVSGDSCTLCAGGKFSASATSCTTCGSGSFAQIPGSASCPLCPAGKSIADDGATDTLHDSISDCIYCVAGTYFDR